MKKKAANGDVEPDDRGAAEWSGRIAGAEVPVIYDPARRQESVPP